MLSIADLDPRTRGILNNHGFDTIPFTRLAEQLRQQGLDPDRNRLRSAIEMPPPSALTRLPSTGDDDWSRLKRLGEQAIKDGRVGVVILNGGMATRFGGGAKGVAPALFNQSFLDIKLRQVEKSGFGRVPVLLMNSFATEQATEQHLELLKPNCDVRGFSQMVSLRLTPSGELFLTADGSPSLHATGHGDLPFALRRSGELKRFIADGGRYLAVSNVDNLAAGLSPVVIGVHLDGKNPVTVELVRTYPGDVGGFPALVEGKMCIVEAFRAPRTFDINTIPVFNTNTFVFDAKALEIERDLDWFAVTKKVNSFEVVQFERLVGQLTEFMEVTWLLAPRSGPESRFIPIKNPQDLVREKDNLEAVLRAQRVF